MLPEMKKAKASLQENGWTAVDSAVKLLPKWFDTIGRELCEDVLQTLVEVMKAKVDGLSDELPEWLPVLGALEQAVQISQSEPIRTVWLATKEKYEKAKQIRLQEKVEDAIQKVLKDLSGMGFGL